MLDQERILPKPGMTPPATDADEPILDVRNVAKKFCRTLRRSLWYGVRDMFSETLTGRRNSAMLRRGEFWAVDDVSFQVRRGDALGLIGRNGAGKTTLLRMVAGLIRPDRGVIRARGRIAPLLALGAGFNPVLTGRENIFVNLAVLGLSTSRIRAALDSVVDFAEVESAIDAPVRTYSSGMLSRLGFACAVHSDPDLLLIDEVLAVGDMRFRAKCYRRLADLRRRGTAFVFVSHNPYAMLSICESGVLLERGRRLESGPLQQLMTRYEAGLLGSGDEAVPNRLDLPAATSPTDLSIRSIFFRRPDGSETADVATGEAVSLCVRCDVRRPLEQLSLGCIINEAAGEGVTLRLKGANDRRTFSTGPGECELQLLFPALCLRPGVYTAKLTVVGPEMFMFDAVESFRFGVSGGACLAGSSFHQPREWALVSETRHGRVPVAGSRMEEAAA